MNNQPKTNHWAITREEMCVIEKCPDGSLQTAFHPIAYDSETLGRLRALSEEMLHWESARKERLLREMRPYSAGLTGEQKTDVSAIAGRFRDLVLDVYDLMRIKRDFTTIAADCHADWHFTSGLYSLPRYSDYIRGFDVSPEAVAACEQRLSEDAFQRLEIACRQASAMRPILLSALEEYEKSFFDYIENVRQLCPDAFEQKKYCQSFSGVYGHADLDYVMTPGNQCAVKKIGEYFWACVLERLYNVYESMHNVVAYSHRKRGFYYYKIVLEPKCDLLLFHETNFGFGRVSYFRSTLSYKGVSAINASFLIFFEGAGKVAFSDHTYNYEVEEESFEACFEEAVRVHSEYLEIGEASFVDKYFRKSLEDLSDLLLIVANSHTFLQVTTLERFGALTSGARNVLLPDEGFKNIDLSLSTSEERVVDEIASLITAAVKLDGFENYVGDEKAKTLADKLLAPYPANCLQHDVKKDLARSHVIRKVVSECGNAYDVAKVVDKTIQPVDGLFVTYYEGFELINMRIKKAMSVIRPIERLRKIAALTRFETVIESIASTCLVISQQAQALVSSEITPELDQLTPKRDALKLQIERAEAQMEDMRNHGQSIAWINGQVHGMKEEFKDMNGRISMLMCQKGELQRYIQTVKGLWSEG